MAGRGAGRGLALSVLWAPVRRRVQTVQRSPDPEADEFSEQEPWPLGVILANGGCQLGCSRMACPNSAWLLCERHPTVARMSIGRA